MGGWTLFRVSPLRLALLIGVLLSLEAVGVAVAGENDVGPPAEYTVEPQISTLDDRDMNDIRENDQVRQVLRDNGDSGDRPRLVDHWLYFSDREKRAVCLENARGMGYSVAPSTDYLDRDNPFALRLQRMDVPNALD